MAKSYFVHSFSHTIGLFVIVLGLMLFAREIGWLGAGFPVWPVVLVAFGIFLVAGEMSKK